MVTVVEGNTVEEAAQLLMRHRLRGLPVINQSDTLIGIATEYELVSQEGHTVADLMNRGIISISPEMGWRLDRHRNPEQYIRPRSEIFKLGWQWSAEVDPAIEAHWLVQEAGVEVG